MLHVIAIFANVPQCNKKRIFLFLIIVDVTFYILGTYYVRRLPNYLDPKVEGM
jgi:hypothetical protein